MSHKQGVKRSFVFRIVVPVLIIITLLYIEGTDNGYLTFVTCLLFIYPIFWWAMWSDRCPKCSKWDAANTIKTDTLDRDFGVERYSQTTSDTDASGDLIQTTKNYEKETWEYLYLDHLECKYCHHKWKKKRRESGSRTTRI